MERFRLGLVLIGCVSILTFACGDDSNGEEQQNQNNDQSTQQNTDPNGDQTSNQTNDSSGNSNTDPDPQDSQPEGPKTCVFVCQEAGDCLSANFDCIDQRCEYAGATGDSRCESDDGCIPQMSGWQEGCGGQVDCDATQACVELNGDGFCALKDSADLPCGNMEMESMEKPLVEGDGTATVCGNNEASCHDDNYCFVPCQSNDECIMDGASTCHDDGTCGCGSDADCEASDAGDVCEDGQCTCSGQDACEEDYICE